MMLPFLILFNRKADRTTWLSLAAVCLGLCLLSTPVTALIPRCREMLRNISVLQRSVNNYEYSNSSSVEILGIDRAFYCMGIRDRTAVILLQALVLALLGCLLVYEVVWLRGIHEGAAASLVAHLLDALSVSPHLRCCDPESSSGFLCRPGAIRTGPRAVGCLRRRPWRFWP